jgi:hypothetical protein
LRGFSRAAGGQRRRESRRSPRAEREGESSAIQSAGVSSCELDDKLSIWGWMERFWGGVGGGRRVEDVKA